jgi:hypothetical protein
LPLGAGAVVKKDAGEISDKKKDDLAETSIWSYGIMMNHSHSGNY